MKNETILAIVAGTVGAVGIGLGIWSNGKLHKVLDKLDKAVDDFDSDKVDISEMVINDAVENAANKAVKKVIDIDNMYILRDAKDSLKKAASDAVDKEIDNYKSSIKEAVEKKIADISIESVKGDIVANATKNITERYSRELDGLMDNYNKQLGNITKLFKNSAAAASDGRMTFVNF